MFKQTAISLAETSRNLHCTLITQRGSCLFCLFFPHQKWSYSLGPQTFFLPKSHVLHFGDVPVPHNFPFFSFLVSVLYYTCFSQDRRWLFFCSKFVYICFLLILHHRHFIFRSSWVMLPPSVECTLVKKAQDIPPPASLSLSFYLVSVGDGCAYSFFSLNFYFFIFSVGFRTLYYGLVTYDPEAKRDHTWINARAGTSLYCCWLKLDPVGNTVPGQLLQYSAKPQMYAMQQHLCSARLGTFVRVTSNLGIWP